jgi:hypothetical protein
MRAHHAGDSQEREDLTARWQVAHDMCSLASCIMAFEECKEGDAYDLGELYLPLPLVECGREA